MIGEQSAAGKLLHPRESLIGNALRYFIGCGAQFWLQNPEPRSHGKPPAIERPNFDHGWCPLWPMLNISKNPPDERWRRGSNKSLDDSHNCLDSVFQATDSAPQIPLPRQIYAFAILLRTSRWGAFEATPSRSGNMAAALKCAITSRRSPAS